MMLSILLIALLLLEEFDQRCMYHQRGMWKSCSRVMDIIVQLLYKSRSIRG
jgi:hypothetical protein